MAFDLVDLSSDERTLQQTVRDFAIRRLAPRAADLDREGRFPVEALSEMAKLGFFGLAIPEEFGGLSAKRVQISVVIGEISRACAATALTLMAHLHSSGLIARFGNDDQRRRWLPETATGERLAAIGLTEPEAGTDVASIRSVARREGDHYVIDAHKTFITNGNQADVLVIFAKIRDWQGPGEGISAFIVDANDSRVSASAPFNKMGLRASSTAELHLDGVFVPVKDRLGGEGAALPFALQSLDDARMSTGAQALGLAQGAFDIALRYSVARVQSGKVIAHHQAVQLRLADMQVAVAASRALLYQVARAIDAGGWDTAAPAAAAKILCTQNASAVTSRAVELLGGYGFMEEYQLSRFMRDAKGGEIYDGTNDVNRLLIARQLIKGL